MGLVLNAACPPKVTPREFRRRGQRVPHVARAVVNPVSLDYRWQARSQRPRRHACSGGVADGVRDRVGQLNRAASDGRPPGRSRGHRTRESCYHGRTGDPCLPRDGTTQEARCRRGVSILAAAPAERPDGGRAAEPEHEPGLDSEGPGDFGLGEAEPHSSTDAGRVSRSSIWTSPPARGDRTVESVRL